MLLAKYINQFTITTCSLTPAQHSLPSTNCYRTINTMKSTTHKSTSVWHYKPATHATNKTNAYFPVRPFLHRQSILSAAFVLDAETSRNDKRESSITITLHTHTHTLTHTLTCHVNSQLNLMFSFSTSSTRTTSNI